jgi:dephospho-CoA kinase
VPVVRRVALTGGIATGKSESLKHFRALGAATLDADTISRQVVEPGTPGLDAVVARFGRDVLKADGSLNRGKLGRIVFGDEAARKDLEAIIHPAVYEAMRVWFDDLKRAGAGAPAVAIAEIPLLFETGREGEFDEVVVTACGAGEQAERLMARDDVGEGDARRRVAAQWPLDEKVRRAGHVIDTSGSIEDTRTEVERVWRDLIA